MSTKSEKQSAPRGPLGRLAGKFLDLNLAAKISLMFSGIILIVLVFTALVLSKSSVNFVRAEQDARCIQALSYVRILIEKDQRYIDGLTEYYTTSAEAQKLVNDSNAGLPVSQAGAQDLLMSARFKLYLLSVVFYNLEGEPIAYVSIDNSRGPLPQAGTEEERPFERLMASSRSEEWEYIPQYSGSFMELDHSPKLALWKKMDDLNTQRTIGVVAVTLDVRKLLGADDSAAPSNVLLLSRDGQVVLNRSGLEVSEGLCAQLCGAAGSEPQVLEAELSGQERKIYYEACAGTPFISCIIEEDSGPLWSETSLIRSALLIICLFLVAMLPLTRVLVTMLTRPLAKLSESMLRFSRGDYNAKADFRYGDEIGRLGRVFNHMVEENRRLVELNYVLKLQEKEAELSMLQMQINPHFLYNMLNTAYWCALKNKDEPTAGIMYKLGQFFRVGLGRRDLGSGGELDSVGNCVNLVRYYLELQQCRYGSRLQWTIDADPEMYGELMPKLILQPLVENSIVHGMDSGKPDFSVRLSARMSAGRDRLIFSIEDNGVGFPEELLERWPDGLDEYLGSDRSAADGQRLALRNIYERLRIRYQGRAEFCLRSLPEGGAGVYMDLPNDYREANRNGKNSAG